VNRTKIEDSKIEPILEELSRSEDESISAISKKVITVQGVGVYVDVGRRFCHHGLRLRWFTVYQRNQRNQNVLVPT
jgi:hypothetical protein